MSRSYYSQIPIYLRDPNTRQEFMGWVFRQDLAWTDKKGFAFTWARLNHITWTETELRQMGAIKPASKDHD